MQRDLQKLMKAEHLITTLNPEQRDRLLNFLEILLVNREGQATEAEVMRYMLNLPQKDVQPFTDIMMALQ